MEKNIYDKFSSRDEEIRATISKEETTRLIEKVYLVQYDPDCGLNGCFDAWDQLLACESIAESTTIKEFLHKEKDENNKNVDVSGSGIGGNKLQKNDSQNSDKNTAIAKLKESSFLIAPKKIAPFLENIFGVWQEKPNHWLYIAQHYTPKSINSVINEIDKSIERGSVTLQNPGAYFTSLIKYHPKRKYPKRRLPRGTNGSYKRRES